MRLKKERDEAEIQHEESYPAEISALSRYTKDLRLVAQSVTLSKRDLGP